jgi:sortase family protein
MRHGHSFMERVRFYIRVTLVYSLTVGFIWFTAIHPLHSLSHVRTVALTKAQQHPYVPTAPKVPVISGRPVRIAIPDSAVDLPVDEGYYNSTDNSWTLSGYHAQFAMISTLANNTAGDTFIYGHNNDYVFGALRHNTPAAGAPALLYTDNGHIFAYSFVSAHSVAPDDIGALILKYNGPSMLTIQTCTGSLNEVRTMYSFVFDEVVQ